MNITKTILSIMLVCAPLSAFAQYSDSVVLRARAEAASNLRTYISSLDSSRNTTMLEEMYKSLRETNIADESYAPSGCDERGMIAFVQQRPFFIDAIFLCRAFFSRLSIKGMVQTLIHESFHVAQGRTDQRTTRLSSEIGALKVEANIMEKLEGCSHVDYRYFENPLYLEAIQVEKIKILPICK